MADTARRDRSAPVREAVLTLALAALLYAGARRMFLLVTVEGRSMLPTLADGQRLLAFPLAYRWHAPTRGDIVVIAPRLPEGPPIIKRLIGLPGERIVVRDGQVCINGVALDEPYVAERPIYTYPTDEYRLLLRGDQYLVLGDNRNASVDSHLFGPIRSDAIIGPTWDVTASRRRWGNVVNRLTS